MPHLAFIPCKPILLGHVHVTCVSTLVGLHKSNARKNKQLYTHHLQCFPSGPEHIYTHETKTFCEVKPITWQNVHSKPYSFYNVYPSFNIFLVCSSIWTFIYLFMYQSGYWFIPFFIHRLCFPNVLSIVPSYSKTKLHPWFFAWFINSQICHCSSRTI